MMLLIARLWINSEAPPREMEHLKLVFSGKIVILSSFQKVAAIGHASTVRD